MFFFVLINSKLEHSQADINIEVYTVKVFGCAD